MSTDDSPERDFDVYDREGFLRAPLEDAEGTSLAGVSECEDLPNPLNSTEKPKSYRSPRREVRWFDLGTKNQSLESIKKRFEDCLDRFLLSSSNSLLRHITSPMDGKLRHNRHQCPGYLREEITLASDVSKSVIISHAFPSQSEVCSICGQLVRYKCIEPSIVDIEMQEAPHYPSQNNSQNMTKSSSLRSKSLQPAQESRPSLSLSPSSSSMEGGASNISEIQLEIYGYSASHPSLPTRSGALDGRDSHTCLWEDCGRVFAYHDLLTLIHHIHNGKFFLVLGCMPSVAEVDGGQHFWQTPRWLLYTWCHLLLVRLREISPFL